MWELLKWVRTKACGHCSLHFRHSAAGPPVHPPTLSARAFILVAPEGIWITIMNQLIIVLEKFQGWIKHQTWCSRCTTNRHLLNELFSARRWRLELYSHALNVKYASLDLLERGKDKHDVLNLAMGSQTQGSSLQQQLASFPGSHCWGRWRLQVYPSDWLVPLLQM